MAETYTDEQYERMVAFIVNRMHVSASDKGVRSTVGRKISKDVSPEERARILDAAVRVHHGNRDFYKKWRF